MKYWVFQNNQVTGPYDNEDLTQVPGYSAETLVCPEGRRGTSMGDWQRASMVPDLSLSIIKAGQLAVALKGSGGYGNLPPEPTLKDLAALGSLQEKMSLLDNTVGHLQESLRLKEEELLSVHKELDDKARYAQELAVKLGGLEERFSQVGALQQGLDKAVEAEHDVESTVQKQSQLIEDLSSQLQSLRDEQRQMEQLREELSRLKAEQQRQQEDTDRRLAEAREAAEEAARKAAAAAEEAALKAAAGAAKAAPAQPLPGLRPEPGFPQERPSDRLGLPSERPAGLSPLGDSQSLSPSPLSLDASPAPAAGGVQPLSPLGGDSLPPLGGPGLPPLAGGSPLGAPVSTFDPLGGAGMVPPVPDAGALPPGPTPASVVPEPAPAAPKKNLKPLVLVVVVVIAAAAGGAYKLGLLGGKKRAPAGGMPAAPMADRTPLPTPPVAEAPKPPTPEELAEQEKKDAVELVKIWQLPDGGTISSKLETGAPPAGGLSPWMADKGKTGLIQVNFYAPKTAAEAAKTYEFEVSVADKKVAAHNEAAAALLKGKPAVSAVAKNGRSRTAKPKIKPKPDASDSKPMLEDLLNVSEDPAGAKPRTVASKRIKSATKAKPAAEGDDVMIDGSGVPDQAAAAPAPKAVRKAKRPVEKRNVEHELNDLLAEDGAAPQKGTAAPPKQESLDDLLEPSSAAKPENSGPQADPSMPADDASSEVAETSVPKKAPKAAAAKPAKAKGQAADAELLDDLLKP